MRLVFCRLREHNTNEFAIASIKANKSDFYFLDLARVMFCERTDGV